MPFALIAVDMTCHITCLVHALDHPRARTWSKRHKLVCMQSLTRTGAVEIARGFSTGLAIWAARSDCVCSPSISCPSCPDCQCASGGRVVTSPRVRGTGLGRPLMREAIAGVHQTWGPGPIKLSAQAHLRHYYESLGFAVCGEGYLEDGIPHLPMRRA